jgi:hypothetical protein
MPLFRYESESSVTNMRWIAAHLIDQEERMPRFFFHLHNDVNTFDEEGSEFPDLASAREHARAEALHMAAASVTEHQRLNGDHRIEVADQSGEVLCSVFFRELVQIKP